MPRMFVEDQLGDWESPRMGVQRLMRELDDHAAREGHRVDGDVTIQQFARDAWGRQGLRLEADVIPSV